MNILFLSRWFPFPPDNGARIRVHHLLNGLSQLHDVTLLAFCDLPLPSPEDLKQHQAGYNIQVVPWKPFNSRSLKARLGFFSSSPRFLIDTHSPQMESLIRKTLAKRKFDIVIAFELSMAAYFPAFQGIPALIEDMELGLFYGQAFHDKNLVKRFRLKMTWYKLQLYFSRLLDSFAACTVVSENERQILIDNFPRHAQKIKVLPNCINLMDYQKIDIIPKPLHLIFTGSFRYQPNYHAMQWFIHDVYPLILKQIPDVQLIITGDHANLPLPPLKNVTLTGYVEDIKSLIASCDVSIAPIWNGGGTRLKILESMAIGTPVVSTSKGAEGLLVQSGEHILIADEPENFAEHVVNLLQDKGMSDYLSSNALHLIKDHYDWATVMPRFLRLVEEISVGTS